MNNIVILSAGPGLPEIVKKYGHSSEWIPNILEGYDLNFDVKKSYLNDFGNVEDADAWIITGSKYSVYEKIDWITNLEKHTQKIISSGKPILGICFGHQMIAKALNGNVQKNSLGWELGSYSVELTNEGLKNPLFYNIDNHEIFYESHQDAVVTLPDGAISLAETPKSNQSFQYGKNVYGVQFHPEFSFEITRLLMDLRIEKGVKVDSDHLMQCHKGHCVLQNFIHIIESIKI